jgi:hypothetical protein
VCNGIKKKENDLGKREEALKEREEAVARELREIEEAENKM